MCIAVSIACRRERYHLHSSARGSTNPSRSISLPPPFTVSFRTQPRSLKQHTRSLPCFLLQQVSCTATATRRSGRRGCRVVVVARVVNNFCCCCCGCVLLLLLLQRRVIWCVCCSLLGVDFPVSGKEEYYEENKW